MIFFIVRRLADSHHCIQLVYSRHRINGRLLYAEKNVNRKRQAMSKGQVLAMNTTNRTT